MLSLTWLVGCQTGRSSPCELLTSAEITATTDLPARLVPPNSAVSCAWLIDQGFAPGSVDEAELVLAIGDGDDFISFAELGLRERIVGVGDDAIYGSRKIAARVGGRTAFLDLGMVAWWESDEQEVRAYAIALMRLVVSRM